MLSTSYKGTVIATYRRHTLVETETKAHIKCQQRKSVGKIVCGDSVEWVAGDNNTGIITKVNSRHSVLQRPDKNNKPQVIAANIDQIFIVTSAKPELNEGLVDRYLVAAELSKLQPVILLNKTDLLDQQQRLTYSERLSVYEKMGYHVIYSSTKTAHGLDEITRHLSNKNSIFVGQSGVGKSSLINFLFDDSLAEVDEISASTGKGKHTTTTAFLYPLKHSSGHIIDSPGIREFGITAADQDHVINGFKEFRPFLGNCKFRDCQHKKEPGCALLQAVAEGHITSKRWESYQRIMESIISS